jgi:ribosomal protein S18 acetylase RimI-like enzyme
MVRAQRLWIVGVPGRHCWLQAARLRYEFAMREERLIETASSDADLLLVSETLGLAFAHDPALTWIVPDTPRRLRMLPDFFRVMAGQSRRNGEVLASPDRRAAALWYPPGKVSDGLLPSLGDNLSLLAQFGMALPRGLKVAAQMHKRHPRPQPHAYLRYVGVAPSLQGQGWGSALVREGVARAAEKGQGVLLETATQSNVAIYARLGFEIAEEWRVPGGPQFWTMIHPAP